MEKTERNNLAGTFAGLVLALLFLGYGLPYFLSLVGVRMQFPHEVYREWIASGSASKPVMLPSAQARLVKIDRLTKSEEDGQTYIWVFAHNGSKWTVSSFDLVVQRESGEDRKFRLHPGKSLGGKMYVMSLVAVGPNQPITAACDVGEWEIGNGWRAHIDAVYGYK